MKGRGGGGGGVNYLWMVEERVGKRAAWAVCDIVPLNKADALNIVADYKERAANWIDCEYRVVKYIREEVAK